MNYLEKIKTVRDDIQKCQKEPDKEFSYTIMGFGIGEDPIDDWTFTIPPEEELEIVKYLERRGFLELIKEAPTSVIIKILPQREPIIKSKTLELISRELKDHYTGYEITTLLEKCRVDKKFIIYPNSKWLIFYGLFEELTISGDKKAKELLFKIITESIHPLNLGGNQETSDTLVKQFNDYLRYDNLIISYVEWSMSFEITERNKNTEKEQTEEEKIQNQIDFEEMEKEEIVLFQTPKKLEEISLLRKNYQTLMNLVETFCENPSKPTTELNNAYVKLKSNIYSLVSSIGLLNKERFMFNFIELNHKSYNIPFSNLFSAEKEFKGYGRRLSWDSIRPEMNAMYGEIEAIYQTVNASDILSEPDAQNQINSIMLLLSKTKEENTKITQEKNKLKKEPPVQKIEIVGMPELQVKRAEDDVLIKGKKKIALPKFTPTDWGKIEMRFINENTVYIKAGQKTATADYESLGFRNDKNGKPNTAWKFLFELAKNNGETSAIKSPIPDNIKQQKRTLSDRLKTIFKNNTDPFDDFSQSNTYRIRISLIPPIEENKTDKYGVDEYLTETMTSKYEQEE